MLPKLHEGSIAACHMSNDAKLLVTGGYDLRIVLWDLENMTHKLVLRVCDGLKFFDKKIFYSNRVIEIGLMMSG